MWISIILYQKGKFSGVMDSADDGNLPKAILDDWLPLLQDLGRKSGASFQAESSQTKENERKNIPIFYFP